MDEWSLDVGNEHERRAPKGISWMRWKRRPDFAGNGVIIAGDDEDWGASRVQLRWECMYVWMPPVCTHTPFLAQRKRVKYVIPTWLYSIFVGYFQMYRVVTNTIRCDRIKTARETLQLLLSEQTITFKPGLSACKTWQTGQPHDSRTCLSSTWNHRKRYHSTRFDDFDDKITNN